VKNNVNSNKGTHHKHLNPAVRPVSRLIHFSSVFMAFCLLGVDFCNFSRLLPRRMCGSVAFYVPPSLRLPAHIFTHIASRGFCGCAESPLTLWTLGFICRRLANEFWLFFAWEDHEDDDDDDDYSVLHKWPTCRLAFVPLNYNLIALYAYKFSASFKANARARTKSEKSETRAAKIKLAKCIYLVNLQTRLQTALTITRSHVPANGQCSSLGSASTWSWSWKVAKMFTSHFAAIRARSHIHIPVLAFRSSQTLDGQTLLLFSMTKSCTGRKLWD